MRFLLFMYPEMEPEDWETPPPDGAVEAMGRFNEELAKAGVLLAAEGLRPPQDAAHVRFGPTGEGAVSDGPFAEAKEVVGGFWLLDVRSRDEAVAWAARVPGRGCTVEVRGIYEEADFVRDLEARAR
jgi:hypothetical protein